MANDFESLGAHLRNLMTPYTTVIQLIDDLRKADENGDIEQFNKIKEFLYNSQLNRKENINDMNTFSFVEPMEQGNWRSTKLFMMDKMLEQMKEGEEIDRLTNIFGT